MKFPILMLMTLALGSYAMAADTNAKVAKTDKVNRKTASLVNTCGGDFPLSGTNGSSWQLTITNSTVMVYTDDKQNHEKLEENMPETTPLGNQLVHIWDTAFSGRRKVQIVMIATPGACVRANGQRSDYTILLSTTATNPQNITYPVHAAGCCDSGAT